MILTRKDMKAYIAADALACGRCEYLAVRLPKSHVIPSRCAHW